MRRLFQGQFLLVIAGFTCVTVPAFSAFESSRTNLIAQNNHLNKQSSRLARQRGGPDRGDGICLISPNHEGDYKTWSTEPLFAWKGTVEKIEVVDRSLTLVWSHNLTTEEKNKQSLVYDEQKASNQLEPGKIYTLRLYPNAQATKPEEISFQVLSEEQRREIQADLEKLKQNNPNLSEKEMAEKRFQYFESKAMNLDAIREFFGYASAAQIEDLQNKFCPEALRQTTS